MLPMKLLRRKVQVPQMVRASHALHSRPPAPQAYVCEDEPRRPFARTRQLLRRILPRCGAIDAILDCSDRAIHFCRQMGLSWSSSARALASATIASRAASHRSALANSWVDTAAPFTAPPSQLTTIRTWVIIGLDGPAERKPGAPDARGFCLGPAVSLRSAANACNRAVPKEPMARAGGLIHVKRGTANTLTKLSRKTHGRSDERLLPRPAVHQP